MIRRRFPVGASPTRPALQPEATGAVMEVTKWLKPSGSVSRIGEPRLPLWVNKRPTAPPSCESAPGGTADENPKKQTLDFERRLPEVVRSYPRALPAPRGSLRGARGVLDDPVDRGPADTHPPGDLRGPHALALVGPGGRCNMLQGRVQGLSPARVDTAPSTVWGSPKARSRPDRVSDRSP